MSSFNKLLLLFCSPLLLVIAAANNFASDILKNPDINSIKEITLIKGKKELECDKYQFITRTSSSTILLSYEEWDRNTTRRIVVLNNSDISSMTLENTLPAKPDY